MHIVVITGFYYPYMVPPAGCAKHYLVELAKENDIEVVCPPSNIHYTDSTIQDGIKINYINSFPNRFLSYIRTNQEEHRHRYLTKLLFNTYRGLRYIKSLLSKVPYDTSLINPYVKGLCKIHDEHPIDVVISVSFNFYTHASALQFKNINPSVKWVTYTTDPLAYNEVNIIEKRKLKTAISIEQKVYNKCDYCITTEELYPNLVNEFHISPDKILGLPFLLLDKPLKVGHKENNRPLVIYAGYLYYEIRNPRSMIEVFSRVKEVDLRLYVEGDRFIRHMLSGGLSRNIIVDGLVSRDKYLELLNCADVLINMSNNVRLQAPSKLTELISTGKPIINFYYNCDSGYRMIEKYPLGLNISNDMNYDLAAEKVSTFVAENLHKQISFEDIQVLYPEHTLSVQMPKVREMLTGQ